MNKRLRLIRDETGLSRAGFGKILGVSGDVINNLERGRVEIKEPMVKLICSEFSISESWLRTGTGEMFAGPSSSMLDRLAKEYQLDKFEQRLLSSFLELSPPRRKMVLDYIKHTVDLLNSGFLAALESGEPAEQ